MNGSLLKSANIWHLVTESIIGIFVRRLSIKFSMNTFFVFFTYFGKLQLWNTYFKKSSLIFLQKTIICLENVEFWANLTNFDQYKKKKLHKRTDTNLQIQGCNERNSCGISAPNLWPLCRWILRIVGPPRIVFVPIIQRIEFMTVLSTRLSRGGHNWVKFF